MVLTDIQPKERWAELEQEIYRRSGMRPRVYDENGMGITDYSVYGNPLCKQIQSIPKAQTFICAVAHENMAAIAKNTKEPVIEECDAGMLKIVVPIFSGDQFLGTAGCCGKLMKGGEVDTFMVNRSSEIPEEEVKELASKIETMTEEEAKALTEWIKGKVAELTSRKQANETG